jgi:transposase-like protein
VTKQEIISFMQFKNYFNNEDACQEHLYRLRWPNGYCCPKCGSTSHYAITTRNLFECTDCHYQTSLTAGTVMEKTHMPLEKWFWGIYFFSTDKRGCSASQLSKELSITYKSAWYILHRIRKAMKERDSEYLLKGLIQLDDSFFGSHTQDGKRGRGTEKTKVIVGLSINEKGHPEYLKMKVVDNLKGQTIVDFALAHIAEGSTISSDAYRSYRKLQDENFFHEAKDFDPREDSEHLKWLHTIIGNTKAFINGTYHGLGGKHLQSYLDKFCYRFNRRSFSGEIFNRVLNSCLLSRRLSYTELTT